MALSDGLVGYWSPWLGSSGYRLLDRTAYANHGTLVNMNSGTDWLGGTIQGRSGYVLDFDGSDDYISLGDTSKYSFERTDSFTLSSWIKPSLVSGLAYAIIDKSDVNSPNRGWSMILFRRSTLSATAVSFFATNTVSTNEIEVSSPAGSIIANSWQHILVSYAGTSTSDGVQIYINGIRQSKTITADNLSATILNSSFSPIIGARANGGAQKFPGQIAETCIWKRSISAQEVSQLYRLGPGWYRPYAKRGYANAIAAGFKAYWHRRETQVIGGGLK